MKIAMWSGPRNLSTAMMRSFENRDDFAVTDEPLYAVFLHATRRPDPGFDEVLASQPTDWPTVAASLVGPNPEGAPHWYQKHITVHLLPEIDRSWMADVEHCFLIRDPRAALSSYARTRPAPTVDDLGFVAQGEIFDYVTKELGQSPIVVDSSDVLKDPRRTLGRLCDALRLPFSEKMLSWPAGARVTDGVWAKHWYHSVTSSTGFGPYQPREPTYDPKLQPIVDASMPVYERLSVGKL